MFTGDGEASDHGRLLSREGLLSGEDHDDDAAAQTMSLLTI